MKVLVDTCVWSLALRRRTRKDSREANELRRLISQNRVLMIGPVRQELLSGLSDPLTFAPLARGLAGFPDEPIEAEDYVEAARFLNACRARGIQGSNTDFLICAVASRLGAAVFTTDRDFTLFQKVLSFRLHTVQSSS